MVPFPPASLAARLLALLPQSKVTRHRIASGACVFRQGDVAAAVFVVESGQVRLARILEDGSPLILFVADAGTVWPKPTQPCWHCHEPNCSCRCRPIPPKALRWRWHWPPRSATCVPGWNAATSAPRRHERSRGSACMPPASRRACR